MSGAPPRLLMTADAVGGIWSYAIELARGLAGHGTRTILAVLGPAPSEDQRAQALTVPGLRLEHLAARLEWQLGAEADFHRSARWLTDLGRDADVVHLNGYAHAALPWDVPCVVAAHSCVASWWRAVHGTMPPRDTYGWYLEAVRAGLARADLVLVPTASFLAELEACHGPIRARRVVANGVDPASFGPIRFKRAQVLAAGRVWDQAKNLATLDNAAATLDCPVLIAGDQRSPEGAQIALRHATLVGALPSGVMRRMMAEAAIFASPARYEPFGLAVLEAALSECALVLGDIPTFRELWEGCASFVDPDDTDALAAAVRTYRERAGLRLLHGRRARRRAQGLTARRMVDGVLDAYRSVSPAVPIRETVLAGG